MKKLILLSVLILAFAATKAQEPLFVKGDKVFNIGVGIQSWRIPFAITGEYCVADGIIDKGSIGAGAYLGASYNWYYSGWYGSTYNHFSFLGGARGTFHYPFIEKLDTYAGLSLGIDTWYSHYISVGGFIGARYQLTPQFNVFGELGSGLGYLHLGLSFKLK
jgi:hypothetical protein